MNYTKKVMLIAVIYTTGLYAGLNSLEQGQLEVVASQQSSTALKIIEAMQGCINFYQQAQQPLNVNDVEKNESTWQKAIDLYHKYINDLRSEHNVVRPTLNNLENLPNIEKLTIQSNQSKSLFTRLLDEYIAHLGDVYEQKSGLLGLYQHVYYISSSKDQNLSITPNENLAFIQTLENAASQGDWGTTVNLTLPVIQDNNNVIEKNLTLNEMIIAIKQIPLPTSYYTTALKVGAGIATTVALGAGAYYAYNNPEAFGILQDKVDNIEEELSDMTQPKTIPNWEAGGDAELYGAPGLSDLDVSTATSLLAAGQIAGTLGKAGATAVGTRLGLTGPSVGESAGQGALKGVSDFGKYGSSPTTPTVAPSVTLPTSSTLARTRLADKFTNLPEGYIQPTTAAVTKTPKNVSPTWAVNFGQ